jgi:transketolase
MLRLSYEPAQLSADHLSALERLRVEACTNILTMTTLAGCGHPGGSMSTLHALLLIYANANITADAPMHPERDRIIVSHGHISPGTYSTLAAYGFCDAEEACRTFRIFGSIFGGHVEQGVPGVEWNSGNLGQGLSAAVGSALGARLRVADPSKDLRDQEGFAWRTYCLMGDGEQQKGQIGEARRLAIKYGCSNVCAFIDMNGLQIGGRCDDIMPQQIVAGWASDGWNVLEVDGHDWQAMYSALRAFQTGAVPDPSKPPVIVGTTVMGKGVKSMENLHKWHGQALPIEDCRKAIAELGGEDRLDRLAAERAALPEGDFNHPFPLVPPPELIIDEPIVYGLDVKTDCRSAYGAVMKQIALANNTDRVRVVAFGADLTGSVKLNAFQDAAPAGFIEGGIQEHNSATASGRLSREGFSVFFSTFGIFGVTEVFNQQRLNSFNRTNLKLVCTHCGTDVGEDGPTHQIIDYAGLLRSTFDWEIHVPGDPNQCDRMIRNIAGRPGNQFVGMGRSKFVPISKADGSGPFYDGTVGYEPGRADVLREGDDGAILAIGPMVAEAVKAHDLIHDRIGKRVRVVNVATLRPFDGAAICAAGQTGFVLTAEDHHPDTGLGGLVAMHLADEGITTRLERAGVDQWSMSGKPPDIFRAFRLDANGLAARVIRALT